MERRKNKGLGRGGRGREGRFPLPPRQRAPLSSLCPPANADSADNDSLQSDVFLQGGAVKDLPATLSVADTPCLVEVPHTPLARICEEDEDGAERASDDLQLMYAEDWSSLLGSAGVRGSLSPDRKAEEKLEESRAAKRSRSDVETHHITDTCFSSSTCAWQKLDQLEQNLNNVVKMLLSSMELLHVNLKKEFSNLRSEEERARKEFAMSFEAMFQSHKQNVEHEIVQLRASLGFIAASEAETSPIRSQMPPRQHVHENISAGTSPIHSRMPPRPHVHENISEPINSNLPFHLMEQHAASCDELFQKLQAVGTSAGDLSSLQTKTSPDSTGRCATEELAWSSVQLADKFEEMDLKLTCDRVHGEPAEISQELGAPCDTRQKLTMKEEHRIQAMDLADYVRLPRVSNAGYQKQA